MNIKILKSDPDMDSFFKSLGNIDLPGNAIYHSLLVLTGGTDIDPHIYGESSMHTMTQSPDIQRDAEEIEEVMYAWSEGIPVVGICRGAQLLCALNGGFLVQDMEGHAGKDHAVKAENSAFLVNSTHHQMMVPRGNFEWVAWRSPLSSFYHDGLGREIDRDRLHKDSTTGQVIEPEAIFWPDTQSLAIQWHPEWMEKDYPARTFTENLIKERLQS